MSKKNPESQRAAARRYEESHDRIVVMMDAGFRDRVKSLELGITPARFCKFSADLLLSHFEELQNVPLYNGMESPYIDISARKGESNDGTI